MAVLELAYLMAPAYLANMAPPFARYWRGPNPPLDEPLLGANKTLGGFLLGIAMALLTAAAQAASPFAAGPGMALPVPTREWPAVGLALGIGAMVGDCVKSAAKRARGLPPGTRWLPFDQLDFVVGGLIMLWPIHRPGATDLALLLLFSFVADLGVNRVAFALGIKRTPW